MKYRLIKPGTKHDNEIMSIAEAVEYTNRFINHGLLGAVVETLYKRGVLNGNDLARLLPAEFVVVDDPPVLNMVKENA